MYGGIINSLTKLHLAGYATSHTTMHGSMNVKITSICEYSQLSEPCTYQIYLRKYTVSKIIFYKPLDLVCWNCH